MTMLPGQEIVGAIVAPGCFTLDREQIELFVGHGRRIEYVTRCQAQRMAQKTGATIWNQLATAPTLFLVDNGIRFVNAPLM